MQFNKSSLHAVCKTNYSYWDWDRTGVFKFCHGIGTEQHGMSENPLPGHTLLGTTQ